VRDGSATSLGARRRADIQLLDSHGTRRFETSVRVRSYELDSLGHVNHAVFLNYFEHARFQALEEGGFSPAELERRGLGVYVVRVEIDYRAEALLGDELLLLTNAAAARRSSLILEQRAVRPGKEGVVLAEAQVTAVWVDAEGQPVRIPADALRALGLS
jgi:acyl-CoA thioester hydrolase